MLTCLLLTLYPLVNYARFFYNFKPVTVLYIWYIGLPVVMLRVASRWIWSWICPHFWGQLAWPGRVGSKTFDRAHDPKDTHTDRHKHTDGPDYITPTTLSEVITNDSGNFEIYIFICTGKCGYCPPPNKIIPNRVVGCTCIIRDSENFRSGSSDRYTTGVKSRVDISLS